MQWSADERRHPRWSVYNDKGVAMMISTSRFGNIEVSDDSILTFPSGLVGFPEYRQYVVFEDDQGVEYQWLQSIDDPNLALVIIQAEKIDPCLADHVPADAIEALGLSEENPGSLSVVVTIPSGAPEKATVNLRAPILVNVCSRIATQAILQETIPLRFPLRNEPACQGVSDGEQLAGSGRS